MLGAVGFGDSGTFNIAPSSRALDYVGRLPSTRTIFVQVLEAHGLIYKVSRHLRQYRTPFDSTETSFGS